MSQKTMIQQYVLNVVENCGNDMEYMVGFWGAVIILVVNIREDRMVLKMEAPRGDKERKTSDKVLCVGGKI